MKFAQKAWLRALETTAPIERNRVGTLPVLIQELALRFDSASALVSADASLTYRQLAEACNRYARWGYAEGLRRGDIVGLLMPNSPHYMAIWLGLTRIGVTVSLLNTQLRGELLAHSINIVAPRHMIVGAKLCDAVPDVRGRVGAAIEWWTHGPGDCAMRRLDLAILDLESTVVTEKEIPLPELEDRALLIYTSGTTGPPKAANVSHFRIMQWTHWFAGMMDTTPQDRMYACLPMYHSVGGIVATGAPLVRGGTVILREKFSAREFWRDVAYERCTLFQYIGELCRYLINSPTSPLETAHCLRLCCGNGMRGEVWNEFQRRFRIPQILEYYASTEGSFSLYNCEGKAGAIGRIPPFLSDRIPIELVKVDMDSEMPFRDGAGRCRRCSTNETGEAIGQLRTSHSAKVGQFEGYLDDEATRRKILRDVFESNDAWYRTGDLMRRDEEGFYYFVDRIGDTYRWKGENVSGSEVAAVVSAFPGVLDTAVYGVAVPGADGKAGMAAIVAEQHLDLARLRQYLVSQLPDYARPLFLRLLPRLEVTETFKLRKQLLQRDGFDPSKAQDLFVDSYARDTYVPLNTAIYEAITGGNFRF